MPTYLDPSTGIVTMAPEPPGPPGPGWNLVGGSGSLIRTVQEGGTWTAERVHHVAVSDRIDRGWEQVEKRKSPRPESFTTGPRSGIRFGFAKLSMWERKAFKDGREAVAVVLPDEPGLRSSTGCPGSRYHFQVGMITEGVPADYLAEKLLTYRTRQIGIDPKTAWDALSPLEELTRDTRRLSPWQEEKLKGLGLLATHLSDDMAEAAREAFGTGQDYGSWSRRRQWAFAKARRIGR